MTVLTAPASVTGKPVRFRRPAGRIVTWVAEHVLLSVLLVLFVAPVVFVALTSFMTSDQALTSNF